MLRHVYFPIYSHAQGVAAAEEQAIQSQVNSFKRDTIRHTKISKHGLDELLRRHLRDPCGRLTVSKLANLVMYST